MGAVTAKEALAVREIGDPFRFPSSGIEHALKEDHGILFVLDGTSGAGKTTLALALAENDPTLVFVPRYTTRKPRRNASDALEYIFVTPERFSDLIDEGAFIEYRRYKFDASYGLPRKEVDAVLERGANAIGIINLGNVELLKKQYPHAVAILIHVSPETLEFRLKKRGANTAEEIAERLTNARAVDAASPLYDYVVENEGDLDGVSSALSTFVELHIAMRKQATMRS
jgi:guanylate kinase